MSQQCEGRFDWILNFEHIEPHLTPALEKHGKHARIVVCPGVFGSDEEVRI